jgi:hypothetical protein
VPSGGCLDLRFVACLASISGIDRGSLPDAAMPLSSPGRRASLHVKRRASAAQAIEALQQIAEAVSMPEAKDIIRLRYC